MARLPRNKRRALRRIRHQLDLMGVTGRILKVTRTLASLRFRQAFALERQRAAAPLGNLEEVRELALRVLRALGAPLEGVVIKLAWEPSTHQLDLMCVPSIETTAAAFEGAGLRPEDFSSLPGDLSVDNTLN